MEVLPISVMTQARALPLLIKRRCRVTLIVCDMTQACEATKLQLVSFRLDTNVTVAWFGSTVHALSTLRFEELHSIPLAVRRCGLRYRLLFVMVAERDMALSSCFWAIFASYKDAREKSTPMTSASVKSARSVKAQVKLASISLERTKEQKLTSVSVKSISGASISTKLT